MAGLSSLAGNILTEAVENGGKKAATKAFDTVVEQATTKASNDLFSELGEEGVRKLSSAVADGTASVKQLKQFATLNGLEAPKAKSKADLVSKLNSSVDSVVSGAETETAAIRADAKFQSAVARQEKASEMASAKKGRDFQRHKVEAAKSDANYYGGSYARDTGETLSPGSMSSAGEYKTAQTRMRLGDTADEAKLYAGRVYDPSKISSADELADTWTKSRQTWVKGGKRQSGQFTESLTTHSFTDNDFLLRMDASDDIMNAVRTQAQDFNFQNAFIEKQYNAGGKFQESFGFGKSSWSDLTEKQQERVARDARAQFFDPLSETLGTSNASARQGFVQKQLGYDPNSKSFNKAMDRQIKSLTKSGKADEAGALGAYRDYVKNTYNAGATTQIQSPTDFIMEQGFTKQEAQSLASKNLSTAESILDAGGPEKADGLSKKHKFSKLKVAGAVLGGMGVAYTVTDIYNEGQ